MSAWSKDPPKEPGIYPVRIDYGPSSPHGAAAALAQVRPGSVMFLDYGGITYWAPGGAPVWWGPRIEPPVWPSMEEKP